VLFRSGLIGEVGTADTDIEPEGKIFIHGEIWNARSSSPIKKNEKVRVVGVNGMMLTVEKVQERT